MKWKINMLLLTLFFLILIISCQKKEIHQRQNMIDVKTVISLIDDNKIKELDKLFDSGFNINEPIDDENNTLLDYAIINNQEQIAHYLISKGIDVNHVNKNGVSSFTRAIGRLSSNLLNSFLNHGLDYSHKNNKNMNYFEYMLYKRDYLTALNFVSNPCVYDYFSKENNLFVYLIYYWDQEWGPTIGNFLLSKGYQFDNNISYYFYAIDEYSIDALCWLDSIDIDKNKKYFEERYEMYFTPLEYAENKLLEMTNYLGKDYFYIDDDKELITLNKIIHYLSKE